MPRYGVWSFHHDDKMRYRGGPPAFWEIYRRDPHTGVVLQRLTERLDGGVVLRKRAFDTVLHSYTKNRDVGLFGGAAWRAEVCRDLLAGKGEYTGHWASGWRWTRRPRGRARGSVIPWLSAAWRACRFAATASPASSAKW